MQPSLQPLINSISRVSFPCNKDILKVYFHINCIIIARPHLVNFIGRHSQIIFIILEYDERLLRYRRGRRDSDDPLSELVVRALGGRGVLAPYEGVVPYGTNPRGEFTVS